MDQQTGHYGDSPRQDKTDAKVRVWRRLDPPRLDQPLGLGDNTWLNWQGYRNALKFLASQRRSRG